MGTKKEWKCIGEHLFTKNTDVLITNPLTITRRMSFKDKEGKKRWYNDTELRIHGVGTIDSVYAAFESVQTSM